MGKEGIEFFPLQCQLDEKMELLEAEFGLKGFAIIIKLLQRIYREHGYYCEWNSDIALLFARQQGIPCGEDRNHIVAGVVNSAVRRGIFDRRLYEKCGILTSRGIQKRYLDIVYKRKVVRMEKAYLLLSAREIKGNVVISGDSDDRNDKNDDRNRQSKGKESKETTNVVIVADQKSATPAAEKYPANGFEMRCVDRLIRSLLDQMPGARVPASLKEREKWADEVEKMKRLDKRSEQDIWNVLDFAIKSPFWRSNIRSTRKLREKYETLYLQMTRPKQQQAAPNRFHNLEEHGYDYDEMVWKMMGAGGAEHG